MSSESDTKTSTTPPVEAFSLREASAYSSKSEMYLRKCVTSGPLPSKMVTVTGNIKRHEIAKVDLDAFLARTSNRSSREDGRNKYTIYMTGAEEEKVRKLLAANELMAVSTHLTRANPSKTAQ